MKLYFSENIIDENLLDNYLKKISKYKIIISEEGIFKITDKIFKEYCEDKPIEEKYIEDFKFVLDKSEINYKEVYSIPLKHKSFDYEEIEPEAANIVRVDMLLNGSPVDALSFVCHRTMAEQRGRDVAMRLKNVIDRQQYEVVIQAAVGAKVLAKERIAPYRKNVLVKSGKNVGGGDVTRKKKLLEKQKKGKKRMKMIGNVQVKQEAFMTVMSRKK